MRAKVISLATAMAMMTVSQSAAHNDLIGGLRDCELGVLEGDFVDEPEAEPIAFRRRAEAVAAGAAPPPNATSLGCRKFAFSLCKKKWFGKSRCVDALVNEYRRRIGMLDAQIRDLNTPENLEALPQNLAEDLVEYSTAVDPDGEAECNANKTIRENFARAWDLDEARACAYFYVYARLFTTELFLGQLANHNVPRPD